MISNFPHKPAFNLGGNSQFKFIPKELVAAYPMISGSSAVAPVSFVTGAGWLMGYATRGTLRYREDPADDGQGSYYIQTITGFVPGDKPELIDLMQLMPDSRYLVAIKDVASRWRLVGSLACPLTFSAVYDSGEQHADQKGFTFTFTCATLKRAPAYNL